jgi:hypothetical protein
MSSMFHLRWLQFHIFLKNKTLTLNSKTFQLVPIICSKNKFNDNYLSLFSSFKKSKEREARK